jgi:DNA-binding MarR family transcriptional regulator
MMDETTRRVVVALRRIIRTVDIHSRALARDHGLTGPQFLTLKTVVERGSPTTGEVAEAVHLSQATMTGIVDRLEVKGLVRRTRTDRDRRKVRVEPTAAAEGALAAAPSLLQESFTGAFSRLRPEEQVTILSSLEKLVSLMEADHIDASPILATGEILEEPGHPLLPSPGP